MDVDVSSRSISRYDEYSQSGVNRQYDRSVAYQGYQQQRRKVTSSPGNYGEHKINSPTISPLGNQSNTMKNNMIKSPNFERKSSYTSYLNTQNGESYVKNSPFKSYSPPAAEVSMPGGVVYTIKDEHINEQNLGGYSTKSYKNFDNQVFNGRESTQSRVGNQSVSNSQLYKNSRNHYDYNQYEEQRSKRSNNHRSQKNNSIKRRSSKKYESSSDEEVESDLSGSESDISKFSKKSSKYKEKKKQREMVLDMLMEDYLQRKKKEKEELEKKQTNPNQKTPSINIPGFTKPTNDESVPQKSKIPNYEEYSEIDKEIVREKFRNNYNLLISKYPRWTIQMPDFNLLPLRLIHEGYEQIVRTICIYQTAMKWKVYLIIIIAGIEYYGYNVKKFAFLKGLLKAQIKTIHKYDNYLVEFAEMFFSDEVGDEYPAWLRFLGTFASGLACFSSINGVVKLLGKDASAPDFVFEQADKFVSPPEGTAKLHSDGISDVPEVPSGFQDSNTIIGLIGNLFSTFTGQTSNNKPQPSGTSNHQPAHAEPINVKPKVVDDFEDADF